MRFHYSEEGSFQILAIEGEVRVNNLMELKKEFQALLNDKHTLAIDMQGISAIDSSGISLIVNLFKKFQSQERLFILFNLFGATRKVFDEANLDKALTLYDTRQEFIQEHIQNIVDELYPPPGFSFGDKYYVLKNLKCVLCGNEEIKGFVLNQRTQQLVFDGELMPNFQGKNDNNTLDLYSLQMIICPSCYFSTRHINYFTDLKGEFASLLQEKEIHTLVKDDNNRIRLLNGTSMTSNDKFYPPFSAREAYWVYRVAEECAHTLYRIENRIATYDLAYYNMVLTRYCGEKELPDTLRKAYMWYGEIWKNRARFAASTILEALYYLTVISVKLKRTRDGEGYLNELKALESPIPEYKQYLKAATALFVTK